MSEIEYVQFISEQGELTGETADSLMAHSGDTRRHLGFSCYVFNDSGKLLVARMSGDDMLNPHLWTNAVYGHVSPEEDFDTAITQRAYFTLGLEVDSISCIKKAYNYETPMMNGIVEKEFCPLFVAFTASAPTINSESVMEYKWMDFDDYADELYSEQKENWSWQCRDQFKHIRTNPELISRVVR